MKSRALRTVLLALVCALGPSAAFAGACNQPRTGDDATDNQFVDNLVTAVPDKAAQALAAATQLAKVQIARPQFLGHPPPEVSDGRFWRRHDGSDRFMRIGSVTYLPAAFYSGLDAARLGARNVFLSQLTPDASTLLAAANAEMASSSLQPDVRAAIAALPQRVRDAIAATASLEALGARVANDAAFFKGHLNARECVSFFQGQVSSQRGVHFSFAQDEAAIDSLVQRFNPFWTANGVSLPDNASDLIAMIEPYRDALDPGIAIEYRIHSFLWGLDSDTQTIRSETASDPNGPIGPITTTYLSGQIFAWHERLVRAGANPADELNSLLRDRSYFQGLIDRAQELSRQEDQGELEEVYINMGWDFVHGGQQVLWDASSVSSTFTDNRRLSNEVSQSASLLRQEISDFTQQQQAVLARINALKAAADAIAVPGS